MTTLNHMTEAFAWLATDLVDKLLTAVQLFDLDGALTKTQAQSWEEVSVFYYLKTTRSDHK